MYDVIVIGAGPAGASAAIHTGRAGLRVLMLYKDRPMWSKADRIQNYWGFARDMSGAELFAAGLEQARRFGTEVRQEEVTSLERADSEIVVTTNLSKYRSRAIVLATGVSMNSSGIGREKDFEGRGVHYCTECDGYFYKGKRVAVVGNGNFAASTALKLTKWTTNVTVWTNGKTAEISEPLKKQLAELGITVRTDRIAEFVGNKSLTGLRLESGTEAVDGVFVAIGTASSLDFGRELGLDINDGCVATDGYCRTASPGVFAAGDCSSDLRQLAIAGGQGTIAGLAAIAYIRGEEKVSVTRVH